VTAVDAPETALVSNTIIAEVTVRSTGYDLAEAGNRPVRVTLREGDREVASETVELTEDGLPGRVALRAVPERVGTFTYRVEVASRGDEATTSNNVRSFTVRVLDRQIAVLYVEGAARWEYKWIKTALQRDPGVRFTGVVATGRGAFLVQGEKPTADLRKGLPASAEGYESIDVVVLGDIGAEAFEETTLRALGAFVERGGGLLVLGGYRALGGGWEKTPLADLVPVRLIEGDAEQREAPFAPILTPEGRSHPALAGVTELLESNPRPTLEGCSPVGEAKPGATKLLEHPDDAMPVLAVHRYGEGRVAAFAGDTTYRWALAGIGGTRGGLHERFHGQLIRTLFSPEEGWSAPATRSSSGRTGASAGCSRRFACAPASGTSGAPIATTRPCRAR
jgi:hypothetical protein